MLARKTTANILTTAAMVVGVELRNFRENDRGTGYRFQLGLGVKRPVWRGEENIAPYQRLNYKGTRKVAAVCWHGHRDFFRAVYEKSPEAVFITAVARYDGSEGFEETFPSTYTKEIGSVFDPCWYGNACFCDEGVEPDSATKTDYTVACVSVGSDLKTSEVRVMRQSDFLRCPHTIMLPEHYRADGTCKCDDENENMAAWGYTWNGSRWT